MTAVAACRKCGAEPLENAQFLPQLRLTTR